jgi:hypothetical protein
MPNYKITEIEKPFSRTFSLGSQLKKDDLINHLAKELPILIIPDLVTKTRISTLIKIGNFSSKINWGHKDFKTFKENSISWFSGEQQTSNYFVKSKKQDLNSYKKYIIAIVSKFLEDNYKIKELLPNLQTVNIELEKGVY